MRIISRKSSRIGTLKNIVGNSSGGSDPHWSNVLTLLKFEGPDGSTAITDNTGRSWSMRTNGSISTSDKKFGNSSIVVPGFSNSGGFTSGEPDFYLGTKNFTFETWYRVNPGNPPTTNQMFARWDAGTALRPFWIGFVSGNPGTYINGGTVICQGGSRGTDGVWHFYSLTRNGSTWWCHIDGIRQTTSFNGHFIIPGAGTPLEVCGGTAWALPANFRMDETRFTIDVARYSAADYTPPTSPFPTF